MVDDSTPGQLSEAPRSRDAGGRYINETANRPEPMFAPRPVEGDPETGDTSDGGEDPRLRSREAELEPSQPKARQPAQQNDDDDDALPEVGDEEAASQVEEQEEEDEGAEKYPVTIDGEEREVTLKEALAGYVRTQTYHKHMATLQTIQGNMEMDAGRLQQGWQTWHKAVKDYEEDLQNLIPKEPDWDRAFAANPAQARSDQLVYQALYGKLATSRANREAREAKDAEDAQIRLKNYAEWGWAKFLSMHPKIFRKQEDVDKNVKSMRRTGFEAGFNEHEISQVFDPRMNTVLLWASKYKRIVAAQIKPLPSRGRALPPGAATPGIRNAPRKGLDEALKRQQQSGSLDDTANVFSRILERG
jgi:hypothetical protein